MSAIKNKVTYRTAKSLMTYGSAYRHIAVLLLRDAYYGGNYENKSD